VKTSSSLVLGAGAGVLISPFEGRVNTKDGWPKHGRLAGAGSRGAAGEVVGVKL
jgi:hypothetical protein